MTITSQHTQTCFNAWIKCENLLTSLAQAQISFSNRLVKVIDECALICMGTFHAIKSFSADIQNYALLCVGICEECAELCEEEQGEHFRECARICRECSKNISQLAFKTIP